MHTSQIDAKIISNIRTAKGYYLLKLEVPSGFKDAQPGQFIHVRINDSSDPLLRRPFSIHKINPISSKSGKRFNLDILYEVKGRGTKLLAEKRQSEYLNILGPLGRGFDCQSQGTTPKTHIIIAGGMGVAPLVFLAERLASSNSRTIVLIGAANKSKIQCEKNFKDLGCEVYIATEDGSQGFKGKVTSLFEKKMLPRINSPSRKKSIIKPINIYACGPKLMLTELSKICMINKVSLQVSLEEFMGCGIGACLGCAIETKEGFKRVCYDGPVFRSEDIKWRF